MLELPRKLFDYKMTVIPEATLQSKIKKVSENDKKYATYDPITIIIFFNLGSYYIS